MTAPPRIGHTRPGHAETRRRQAPSARKFDHDAAYAMWLEGCSFADIAREMGVRWQSVQGVVRNIALDVARSPIDPHGNGLPVEPDGEAARNGHHRTNGAARSPQQPPPSHCPPPARANGVAANNSAVGEAGGLRGAPAGTFTPVKGQNEKAPLVEAGAPIVRRQHDNDGDLIYVVSLPAAHYTTHSRSLVDELLQPFEPRTVQWVNEMGDAA